jgi:hypothetical protein
MSTIRVRRIGDGYEPAFGQGQADFIEDLDAVAQIIKSRLLLFKGEWWEDVNEGLPMFQSILGVKRGKDVIDTLVQDRILSTRYVTGIQSIDSAYNPADRSYSITMVVDTQFGVLTVSS